MSDTTPQTADGKVLRLADLQQPDAHSVEYQAVDMLAVCTPAGTEDFFRAAGWDLSRPRPDGWEITPASMAAAAAATGQTILGPPLTADEMIPDTYLVGHQAR
jgi:hypothetical protein